MKDYSRMNNAMKIAVLERTVRELQDKLDEMDMRCYHRVLVATQMCVDFAKIANYQMNHFVRRNAEWERIFLDAYMDYAEMAAQDALTSVDRKHPDIVYTQAKIDEALSVSTGGDFLPFQERYDIDNLVKRYDTLISGKRRNENHGE